MQNCRVYEFEDYRIEHDERLLRRNGEVVSLPPKAVDLLIALLEDHGRVVSKDDLLSSVWTDTVVEEANLSHNIFLLRKALGDKGGKFIETVPKRGYRFAAEVLSPGHAEEIQHETVTRISIQEEIEALPDRFVESSVVRETLSLPKPRSKRKWLIASLSFASIAVALVAGFVYLRDRSSASKASEHEMSFTRVTNSGKVACATISPDGNFIAYSQNHIAGEGMLYVQQTGTNREIKLIEPSEIIFGGITFSPDSKTIYYVVYDKLDPKGALYRIPVLGGVPTRISRDFGSVFSVSPDGKQAAFYRKNDEKTVESIMVLNLDGSGESTIYSRPMTEVYLSGSPAFAADGKSIAFAADMDRRPGKDWLEVSPYSVEISSGQIGRLSTETWAEIGKTSWIADGSGIVFVGQRQRIGVNLYFLDGKTHEVRQITKGLQSFGFYGLGITSDASTLVADLWDSRSQIWSTNIDGDVASARQLTLGFSDGHYGLTSLPDGRTAYIARVGNSHDIWMLDAESSDAKPVTADEFNESDLTVSPDGKTLVFSSDRGGGTHLFRINSDGSELQQLTFGETADSSPDISPDGRWIVYAAWRDNRSTIWKTPFAGGEPVQLTDYDSVTPSISPDGTQISCILPSDAISRPSTLAVISVDGGKPLKTFPVAQFGWYYRSARWQPDGKALIFRKEEKNAGNLWRQPLSGGAPEQLTRFNSDLISNFAVSRDGNTILISRGQRQVNTVLIANFR